MDHYPLRFRPILKERVWGGQALAASLGRAPAAGAPIGESWEIVDRPPDTSVAENGPYAGQTLRALCEEYGRRLLGQNAPFADRFPLIVKLLDPNDRLSVQVHPTAAYVERHPESEAPKSEVWYALQAEPGARIVHGLRPGVTIEQFRDALASGLVEPLLQSVAVEPGGFYYIPSGLIHALLPGSIMVEIQQSSDTTFRLYDWGRVGLDGQPRALHVAAAIETAETFLSNPAFAAHADLPLKQLPGGATRTGGLDCPSFRIERVELPAGGAAVGLDPGSFSVITAVAGAGVVRVGPGEISTRLVMGDSALVPAGAEELQVKTVEGATLLLTTLPRPGETRG